MPKPYRPLTPEQYATSHAAREWSCPGCARTLRGNGGISSHRRACVPLAWHHLRELDRLIRDPGSRWVPGYLCSSTLEGWVSRRASLRARLKLPGGRQTGRLETITPARAGVLLAGRVPGLLISMPGVARYAAWMIAGKWVPEQGITVDPATGWLTQGQDVIRAIVQYGLDVDVMVFDQDPA
jgi:hypothetical protein